MKEDDDDDEGRKERKRARIRDPCCGRLALAPFGSPSLCLPPSFFFLLSHSRVVSLTSVREREPNQVRLYVHFMTYGQWRGRVRVGREGEKREEREIVTRKRETLRGVHRGRWTASAMEGDGRRNNAGWRVLAANLVPCAWLTL